MAKLLFEVETRVSPGSCRAITFVRDKEHSRLIWLINLVIACCTGLLFKLGSVHAKWIAVLLAICVVQALFHIPAMGIFRYLVHKAEDRKIGIRFDTEGITLRTRQEDSRISYGEVTEWAETRRFYVIQMKHHTPVALEKRMLSGDQIRALESVLEKETGKPCRKVI